MKRLIVAAVATLAAVAVLGSVAYAGGYPDKGNGVPSGAHFQMNIIGVQNPKSADFTGGNGARMFVGLGKDGMSRTQINLSEGPFAILDANGTDGVAAFQLPNPDVNQDGTTEYSVFVRALGSPKGSAIMQSCYVDDVTKETWCASEIAGGVEPISLQHTKPNRFQNVSKDLLYVDVCWAVDETGACIDSTQEPLFDDTLDSYFWQYDNSGLRIAQMRFYDVETITPWTPTDRTDH